MLDCGVLPCLVNLLARSQKDSILEATCSTITQTTAGTEEQTSAEVQEGESS